MDIREKLGPIPPDHPDAHVVANYQQLVTGLYMYSEAQYPYEVFLWDSGTHGDLTSNDYRLFHFNTVVEQLFGEKIPIGKSNRLQEKHRDFFEFAGEKLLNRKPLRFYRDKYYMWNRFVGRIYTDNGALSKDELPKMRTFAQQVWTFQLNPIYVFEFDRPTFQQFMMGRTEHGNWLGMHTTSVET